MKKLNKHPRLYKRMANTLKKLITNKLVKRKMINGQNKNSLKSNGTNIIQHHLLKPGQSISNKFQRGLNNNSGINQTNNNNDFSRIINVASFRKIPYNEFILRLTPYDYETYLKMIKMNYSCRLEVHITNIRSIKYIMEVLFEKWKNIQKIEPKINLYLIPIRELWIPKELIFFSINDNDRIYDIGDIYTAYGSPSTNILHMKYQWSEEKLNFSINNNNIQNNELLFNNNNLLNNNLSINQNDSINEINDSEYKPDQRLIKALSKIENSNLLNKSYASIYNNLNNNQINFFSNKAIKADDSQDLFDLSDLNEIEMGQNGESSDKKNINITESINRNEDYNLFEEKDYSKFSEQDSILPLDSELMDPMELLGFDNNDKKSDNLSNSISNKVRTSSISKKIRLRHKKISFVNNIKPTESMINSIFVNQSTNHKSHSVLKLRTGYSEVFSNNNINNLNNLAYTSNNNLSEVSSHINNSNHFGNDNQGGSGIFGQNYINKNIEKNNNNNNNNKSQMFNFENISNNELKYKNINLNNNTYNEEDLKDKKENNANSKNDTFYNNSNNNDIQRKKKKIKFVNNVSKENIKELKEIQERQKSKNSSSFLDSIENKKNNTNILNNSNLFINSNISFGKQNQSQNNQNKEKENNEKENIINENNNKENQLLMTPVKKVSSLKNEESPIQKNNSNKKKIIINNNHSNNWHYGVGTGLTRFLANNNSNLGFNLNDTTPFIGQNTINYNGYFDNATLFKSNLHLNNSNIFHVDNSYMNQDNQLSQLMFINRGEEKTQQQIDNSNFLRNEGICKFPLGNLDNINNNIHNNSNHSNQVKYTNNNSSIKMNLNNDENEYDNNLISGLKNDNKDDLNNNNSNNFLNKKRNNTKEQKQKKRKNNYIHTTEKKSKKNINNLSNNNKNMNLKALNYGHNIGYINKEVNNNIPINKQYYQSFPYNIDIPLPSRFYDEYVNNNFKK